MKNDRRTTRTRNDAQLFARFAPSLKSYDGVVPVVWSRCATKKEMFEHSTTTSLDVFHREVK